MLIFLKIKIKNTNNCNDFDDFKQLKQISKNPAFIIFKIYLEWISLIFAIAQNVCEIT